MRKSILAAPIILGILYILFLSPIFKIKQIEFKNSCESSENQQSLQGKNLIFLNTQNTNKILLDKNLCAENVKIKKIYPNKLEVTFDVKQVVAKIEGSEASITQDGFVTKNNDSKNLTTINIPPEIKINPGEKINDQTVLFVLTVIKSLEKSDFNPQSARILTFGDVAVYNNESAVAIFNKDKEPEAQVDSLQSILAKAKIDATKIAKIDLRFDKPVITTK